METQIQDKPVRVLLPRETARRVEEVAEQENRSLDEQTALLLDEALDARSSPREIFQRLSSDYRSRLAREGKLDQTPDQILEELRRIREEVANELYPD